MQAPLVLITNDDGVDAPGLQALVEAVSARYEVLVVAPSGQQSGVGHAITLSGRWQVRELSPGRFSVTGTPADCVYLAHYWLAQRPVSLVLSGINDGYNLGTDILYSGTVAAAAEAAVLGIPGVALSTAAAAPATARDRAARFACAVCAWLLGPEAHSAVGEGGAGGRPGRASPDGCEEATPGRVGALGGMARALGPSATGARGGRPPHLLNVNVPEAGEPVFRVVGLGVRAYPAPEFSNPASPAASGETEAQDRWVEVVRPRIWGTDGARGPDADAVRRGEVAVTPLSVGPLSVPADPLAVPRCLEDFVCLPGELAQP